MLATLPYSFMTMWLAVRSTGLDAANADGKRVLINGASGGLGRLCLQLLRELGKRDDGHMRAQRSRDCLALGAVHAVERGGKGDCVPACGFSRRIELRGLGR